MIKAMDGDYSLQMACNLLSMSLRVGDGQNGRMEIVADANDLRFALDYLDNEIEIYEKWPLDGKKFDDAAVEFDHRRVMVAPLKSLRAGITSALNAAEPEKRQVALKALLEESLERREEVDRRLKAVEASYPQLTPPKRPACHGYMAPTEVLSRMQAMRQKR